jgi:sugar phosphate isomerase/epimerase
MSVNRREFSIGGAAAVLGLGAARDARAYALPRPLGFMLHALRAPVLEDFPATLATMAAMGYEEVELISFTGFSGPHPRDGFDALATMSAASIRGAVSDAGLGTRSAHAKISELGPASLDATLDWAHDLGVEYVVAADLEPTETLDDWRRQFDRLNAIGERVADAGLRLGLHTPNELWQSVEGTRVMDVFLDTAEPQYCLLQLEVSTAQNHGVDNAGFLRETAGRVFSVHLRDAPTPPQPVPYLRASPLGRGDLDWLEIIPAAESAAVDLYVVEMQTQGTMDPIEAYRISADYIRDLIIPETGPG